MERDDMFALERRFWLEGAAVYAALLDDRALMAFPQMGVMAADAVRESLKDAPRWASVEFSDRHAGRPNDEVVVLGYRAAALRADGDPYRCVCTSCYVRDESGWRLVQHQQSPLG
ncbi:nuclear transport factor 2 family protein [Sphingosinicella sp. LHD-64]|uniref:nuclear transport factor 2 family protein n=1 Tax=Sphingosinicella sp. LHD-64 TaxID=3072139 RepID=UPI00280ECF2D|nr:nuclear transport factor 2 family protein [Sphingosinicella sp. LHD-64]MDQ8755403.1 nuclear transport factor 2 family protein [Sphingosinicella sp. LHD-64]